MYQPSALLPQTHAGFSACNDYSIPLLQNKRLLHCPEDNSAVGIKITVMQSRSQRCLRYDSLRRCAVLW